MKWMARKEVFKQSQSEWKLREPERRDAHFSSIHNLVSFSHFLIRLSAYAGALDAVFIQFSCLIWLWTNYCPLLRTQDAKKRVFSCLFLSSDGAELKLHLVCSFFSEDQIMHFSYIESMLRDGVYLIDSALQFTIRNGTKRDGDGDSIGN